MIKFYCATIEESFLFDLSCAPHYIEHSM